MKKVILSIFLAFFPLLCFAQIRSQVCIVRPNYSQNIIDMIYTFVPQLKRLGVEDPNEYIENFLSNGSSGSGFIYVAPNGKNYVITNRHVISDADTSTVIFQNDKDNTTKTFTKLKILAASDELDLAILEFPNDERPFSSGINFFQGDLEDGEQIFTAGYPGLMGTPVWQFGSGHITNNSVYVEQMIKPELSSLIQHSAQVDGGNSGGPLLIKNESGNYEIIGINTWKVYNRQDTNFAIPAATILKFINDVLNENKLQVTDRDTIIVEKSMQLQKTINKFNVTLEEIIDFISIDYVESEGRKIFDKATSFCTAQERRAMNELLKYSPIISVRYTIGWHILNEYHKYETVADNTKKSSVKEDKLPEIAPPVKNEDGETYYTNLFNRITNRVGHVDWIYSNGGWQILKFTNLSKSKANLSTSVTGKKEVEKKVFMPFNVQIAYGKNLLNTKNANSVFNHTASVNITCFDYISVNLLTEVVENPYILIKNEKSSSGIKSIIPELGIQFQIPQNFSKTIVMPYINLNGGIQITNLNDPLIKIVASGNLGGRFYFVFNEDKFGIFIDTSFGIKVGLNKFEIINSPFNISLGIAF